MARDKYFHKVVAADILMHGVLSDEDFKEIDADPKEVIREIVASHKEITPEIMGMMMKHTGDVDGYDFNKDGHMFGDSVLGKYAEHIQNFAYTYKPEATEIDSEIDPNEEHIGPMAQDIEQVNPACIKETPEGVKTVDTGRLALMNAGAIADLARELQEMKGGGE
jgi:hypothetical protein